MFHCPFSNECLFLRDKVLIHSAVRTTSSVLAGARITVKYLLHHFAAMIDADTTVDSEPCGLGSTESSRIAGTASLITVLPVTTRTTREILRQLIEVR